MRRYTDNESLDELIISAIFHVNKKPEDSVSLRDVTISPDYVSLSLYVGDSLLTQLEATVNEPLAIINTPEAYLKLNVSQLLGELRITQAVVRDTCVVSLNSLPTAYNLHLHTGYGLRATLSANSLLLEIDTTSLTASSGLNGLVEVDGAILSINGLIPNDGAIDFSGVGNVVITAIRRDGSESI